MMNNKELYTKPVLSLEAFETEDVITTSETATAGEDNTGTWVTDWGNSAQV